MMKTFTFNYYLKKMWGKRIHSKSSLFIHKGLNANFEPHEQTIKNILAFSDAYRHAKSEHVGDVEYLMN